MLSPHDSSSVPECQWTNCNVYESGLGFGFQQYPDSNEIYTSELEYYPNTLNADLDLNDDYSFDGTVSTMTNLSSPSDSTDSVYTHDLQHHEPNSTFGTDSDTSVGTPECTPDLRKTGPVVGRARTHYVKFFMRRTESGDNTGEDLQWFSKKLTSPNSVEGDILGEHMPCLVPEASECNGQACLIISNPQKPQQCRVPGCPYINDASETRSTPSRHVAMHLRPFLCDMQSCSFSRSGFPLATDLRRHLTTAGHHPSKVKSGSKFFCPMVECPRNKKPFTRLDNLTAHRRSIHGENIEKRRGRPAKTKSPSS